MINRSFLTLLFLLLTSIPAWGQGMRPMQSPTPSNPMPSRVATGLTPDLTDADSNVYATVRIADQLWMAENLRSSTYADGTPIPNVTDGASWTDLTTGAWAHYQNETAYDPLFGKLYNWYAVAEPSGLCPDGWRVSSLEDWQVLSEHLGGEQVAGGALKSTDAVLWQGGNEGATDSVGFSAQPGGLRRWYGGEFDAIGAGAYFWTSEAIESSRASQVELYGLTTSVRYIAFARFIGGSIRCVYSGGSAHPGVRLEMAPSDLAGAITAELWLDRVVSGDSLKAYSFLLPLPTGAGVDSVTVGQTLSDTPAHTISADRDGDGLMVQWQSETPIGDVAGAPLLRLHLTLPEMPIESDGEPTGLAPFRLNGIRLASADTTYRLLGPPKLGDVNGDFRVLAHDASLVLQAVVGLDPLPSIDPVPWSERRLMAADVDANELLQAMDASWMLQRVVGSLAQWPALSAAGAQGSGASPVTPPADPTSADEPPLLQLDLSGDTLRITAPEGGVMAFELELRHPDGMHALDPVLPAASALTAVNPTERGLSLALASPAPMGGLLAAIPLGLDAEGGGDGSSSDSGGGDGSSSHFAKRLSLTLTANRSVREHHLDWTPAGTAVSLDGDPRADLPTGYALRQNHPNPFNPSTRIVFELPEATMVSLEVFDATGRRVASLARGSHPAGRHVADFDASGLANGLYLYRLTTPAFTATRAMLLLK